MLLPSDRGLTVSSAGVGESFLSTHAGFGSFCVVIGMLLQILPHKRRPASHTTVGGSLCLLLSTSAMCGLIAFFLPA